MIDFDEIILLYIKIEIYFKILMHFGGLCGILVIDNLLLSVRHF